MARISLVASAMFVLTHAAWAQRPGTRVAQSTNSEEPAPSLLERPARLNIEQVSLEAALNALTQASGVPLAFSPARMPRDARVSCACADVDMRRALDQLLAETSLEYFELAGQIVLFPEGDPQSERGNLLIGLRNPGRLAMSMLAGKRDTPRGDRAGANGDHASSPNIMVRRVRASATRVPRQGTVTGSVREVGTGQPIAAARVQISGTDLSASTDQDGRFVILDVPAGDAEVQVQMLGFRTAAQTVSIPAEGTVTVDFQLELDPLALDELVVVGYGTAERRDLTGSVASIQSAQLRELRVSRVDEALLGRVPGVEVIQTTGEPGSGPRISVRGIGSITAGNEPLYVVDGYPTENIEMLNPNDIESIDILKDASATAIYGSRGANGVVLITTNRGQVDADNQLTIDVSSSWQQVARTPEFLTAHEQAEYYLHSIRNRNIDEGHDVSGSPEAWTITPPQTALDVLAGRNTTDVNALDHVLRSAPIRAVNVSATGSAGDFRYALSAGYLNEDGVVIESDFDRLTLRANLDGALTDRLNLGLDINTALATRDAIDTGAFGGGANTSVIAQAASAQRYYPVYNDDGSYFVYQNIDASTVLWNPVALAKEFVNKRQQADVLSNVKIGYTFSDRWNLQQMLGGTVNVDKEWNFRPRMDVFFNEPAQGADGVNITTNWISETTLNYGANFGDHALTGLAGFTAQRNLVRANAVGSNLYPSNLAPTLDGTTITEGGSNESEWTLLSYLARLNYDYLSRYYLTASIRTDGSSRFGGNNKYAVFPSVALAWRVSEEPLFRDLPFVNDFKLRLSYGETGNNNIGNYQDLATIDYLSYNLGGAEVQGYAPLRFANPNLTWEKQRQYNFGVDAALFDNRLQLTLDHFRSTNYDLLLNVPVPRITGFENSLQNIGEVKNTGWELSVSTLNLQTSRFQWSSDFNISTYRNEVVKLGSEGAPILAGGDRHITMIGEPIGMHYGLLVDGIFENMDEVAEGPLYNPGAPDQSTAGDIRFVDLDGDGVITANDRTIIGSPYPDFYFGMNHRLSYGNFSLSVSLQGTHGNEIRNQNNVIFLLTRSRSKTLATERNYWRSEEDPGDGRTPRPNDATTGGIRLHSERYLEVGSYLRVNNITLSYVLPDAVKGRLGVASARAYLNATNPLTFTGYTSWNPAAASSANPLTPGVDQYQYPLAKALTFGLSLTM